MTHKRYSLFDLAIFATVALTWPHVPWWGTMALFVIGSATSAWIGRELP